MWAGRAHRWLLTTVAVAAISAAAVVHIAQRVRYRVAVTAAGQAGAASVRRARAQLHRLGLASARGHLFPPTHATATDVAQPAHAATQVLVLGPLVACTATAHEVTAHRPPIARAAC